MNVSVKEAPILKDGVEEVPRDGKPVLKRRALVANKDFAVGDVIYQEQPMVTALDLDLEGKGTHCSHCLRKLEEFMSIRPPEDVLHTTYCSKACQIASSAQSHNLLFGDSPVLPPESNPLPRTPEDEAKRRAAQVAFAEYIKATGKVSSLLVARFVARTVSNEIGKLAPGSNPPPPSDLPEADNAGTSAAAGAEYTFYDHVERLRYLEIPPSPLEEAELQIVRNVLNGAMPGLDEFIQDERYLMLKGKVLYNAIGVSVGGGRLDKPKSGERFEKWELTRTPYGTSRQTGTGFYRVSSYLAHSCSPAARPSFPKGTAELYLVANRAIKKGEELTISYVRSNPTEGETAVENRVQRRQELARGWRFACECEKCLAEVKDGLVPGPAAAAASSKA